LATDYAVLPVAGTAISSPYPGSPGSLWLVNASNGSAVATMNGVVAPAKSIVSTMNAGHSYIESPTEGCGDSSTTDQSGIRFSNGYGDGVGTCTGISMSAPHVTAVAGLVRSVNPRLNANDLRQIIRESGNLANTPRTVELGYGLPNANAAVDAAILTNPVKLTPLFSFYSTPRSDSFYTTVPQMANSAMDGTLRPRVYSDLFGYYMSAYGGAISGYWSFPRNVFVFGGGVVTSPKAEVWIFTTHINPKSPSVDLEPLIRMSWKCGDDTPKGVAPGAPGSFAPAVCGTAPRHIDTVLVNQSELAYFDWLGYKVDGTEGYVYPKTLAQPAGTVRLMRKYNRARDDFAAFPDTALATMQSNGYTEDGNLTDWLGYVYPNTNGQTPVIQ
jgi:serine protease